VVRFDVDLGSLPLTDVQDEQGNKTIIGYEVVVGFSVLNFQNSPSGDGEGLTFYTDSNGLEMQ